MNENQDCAIVSVGLSPQYAAALRKGESPKELDPLNAILKKFCVHPENYLTAVMNKMLTLDRRDPHVTMLSLMLNDQGLRNEFEDSFNLIKDNGTPLRTPFAKALYEDLKAPELKDIVLSRQIAAIPAPRVEINTLH